MKKYKLLAADGSTYEGTEPRELGGNRNTRIYGRMVCSATFNSLQNGTYAEHRVFFKDEDAAIATGFRPCGTCMKERHAIWKAGGTPGTEAYPWKVIGTMNDMKFALDVEADEPSGDGRDMEAYLNRTPYGAIDYAYPCERFYGMAKAAARK